MPYAAKLSTVGEATAEFKAFSDIAAETRPVAASRRLSSLPTEEHAMQGSAPKERAVADTAHQGRPLQVLDVGSQKELATRSVVGDEIEIDHVPAFAQIKRKKEIEIGRPLTKAETTKLYQETTTIAVPSDVHRASRTYGGRNTPTQIEADVLNLCKAACNDLEVHRRNLLDKGYTTEQIDKAFAAIKARNSAYGIK